MSDPELVQALTPVVDALESLGVRYYVGGSVASAAHGVPRASIDVDLVAELRPEHVARLAARLGQAYYFPEERAAWAARERRAFNVIHLATMWKVDVFVSRGRAFDDACFDRVAPSPLTAGGRPFRIASAEDIVLLKLDWYRAGNEVSERQWSDVHGVLKGRDPDALDVAYLRRWAAELDVADLLERALREAFGTADR